MLGTPAAPAVSNYEEAARLRASLQEFVRTSERISRKHGLTTERYQLLLFIKVAELRGEVATVGGLATALHLAKSTVTQLVRRAENLRLIRRELSAHDARVHYLRLTDEGDVRLAGAVEELGEERSRLLSLLARLNVDTATSG